MAAAKPKKPQYIQNTLVFLFAVFLVSMPVWMIFSLIRGAVVARQLRDHGALTDARITKLQSKSRGSDIAFYHFTLLTPAGQPQTFYREERISDEEWDVLFFQRPDSDGMRTAQVRYLPTDPTVSQLVTNAAPAPASKAFCSIVGVLFLGSFGLLGVISMVKQFIAWRRAGAAPPGDG